MSSEAPYGSVPQRPRSIKEPYAIPVIDAEKCSFPQVWRDVIDACTQAFSVFETKPEADLAVTYNELNKKLCRAHSVIYRIAAFPCLDCPALVRGSSLAKVVGDKPQSTQVLIIYYLLREFLKKQLQQCKSLEEEGDDIINKYLDAFEIFTGGVNMAKCVFTYVHWVWGKLGLPTEHTVLPTEILALNLWSDTVANKVKSKLWTRAEDIVKAVRLGSHVEFEDVESVKRLSLNLIILNDTRQTLYTSVVEVPYLASVTAFYTEKKQPFKEKGPEQYVRLCCKALKKEEFLSKCFLSRRSLEKVRMKMVEVLIDGETEYLKPAANQWLRSDDVNKSPRCRKSLSQLYELLGGGSKATWMEDLVGIYVTEKTKESVGSPDGRRSDCDVPALALRSAEHVYKRVRKSIDDVFGAKPLLYTSLLSGLKKSLSDLCADTHEPTIDADSLPRALVGIVAEEISCEGMYDPSETAWIADVYGLLDKKDVFHGAYEKALETRLLKSTCFPLTKSDCQSLFDREEAMLGDLFAKGKCFDFVSSCHTMLTDVYISSQALKRSGGSQTTVNPLVLTKFVWKGLTPPKPEDWNFFPAVVSPMVDAVKNSVKGNGKNLSFLPHYSTAVVRVHLGSSDPKNSLKLVVSCCQLSLLSLFNQKEQWSLSEIEGVLKISAKTLDEALKPLTEVDVLTLNYEKTSVSLNRKCSASRLKRSILVPEFHFDSGKARLVPENAELLSSPARERPLTVEACVVKLLKTAGEAALGDIQTSVCETLSRFDISRRDVKKIIEKLIEKQFIERDTEKGTFRYVA